MPAPAPLPASVAEPSTPASPAGPPGPVSAPRTARERVREEMTAEILAVAGAQVARDGAAALSLRSIARDLGMAPSALYRYFDGRDALLTALILTAYEALAAEAERAADQARVAAGGEHGGPAPAARAVPGGPARPSALGARAPAPVGADLRHPDSRLPGTRSHRRAVRPGGRRPGAPAGGGGGGGTPPPSRGSNGAGPLGCRRCGP